MDEHVRPASVWLDEAIPLCRVEPLHCPHSHFEISLKQKERLDKRDSSVDLAAIQRQKAVAELSQRRLSVIIVNTLLPSLALRHVASRCRLRFLSDQRRTEIGSRHQQIFAAPLLRADQTSCFPPRGQQIRTNADPQIYNSAKSRLIGNPIKSLR